MKKPFGNYGIIHTANLYNTVSKTLIWKQGVPNWGILHSLELHIFWAQASLLVALQGEISWYETGKHAYSFSAS